MKPDPRLPTAAIVDFGMGNLFSVAQACSVAGMRPAVTSDPEVVRSSDAVVLPGVGAFGDAMDELERTGVATALLEVAERGVPLLGVCLGMQLLMSGSEEFGWHRGLDLVSGKVTRIAPGHRLKVPHMTWSELDRTGGEDGWGDSVLRHLADGDFMYFTHSFAVRPESQGAVIATSSYGDDTFCSALQVGRITGVQFHPERSGSGGISIYGAFADTARRVRLS